MPGIDEFKTRLKQIQEEVRARLPEVATVLVLSAKALAERNIKDKGFGEIYSTERVPVWFLEGKELNQKGTAFLAKKKKQDQKNTVTKDGTTIYPGDAGTNWQELRGAQGLQIAFVDLSYSNKMWANMTPLNIEEVGNIVRAFLGATNREAQNKMNWNRDNYGDFIGKALGEKERDILTDVVINEMVTILDQFNI